jgi:hypothetical protein
MAALSESEVLRQINKVKGYVQEHSNTLPLQLYSAMDGLSRTALDYKKYKGEKGWATNVKDNEGKALWTTQQANVIEEAMPLVFDLAGGASKQQGGASNLQLKDFSIKPDSEYITSSVPTPSIDEMVGNVQSYLAALDQKNRELASIIGPVAFFKKMGDPTIGPIQPYLPAPVQVPYNLVLVSINAMLEACRLLVSNNFFDIGILRKILSFVLAIYDVSRGEWKDGVLSFLGVFGQNMMIVGMIGKASRWIFNFMSPDIQARLGTDLYQGSKSMIIGSWLWLLSIISPDYIRITINDMVEKTLKIPMETFNEKLETLEKIAQTSAEPLGLQVSFPRVPIDKIPSFDDIQNFQTFLHQPAIYCSPAFKEAVGPAMAIPSLRIVFELLNIPVTEEATAKACAGQPASIVEAATEALKPSVSLKEQKGGKRKTKKLNRKMNINMKTKRRL